MPASGWGMGEYPVRVWAMERGLGGRMRLQVISVQQVGRVVGVKGGRTRVGRWWSEVAMNSRRGDRWRGLVGAELMPLTGVGCCRRAGAGEGPEGAVGEDDAGHGARGVV